MENLKKVIGRTLAVDEEKINLDSSPENIASWDSFNSFMLISDIESNFNIKLSSEDIMNVKNVKDIVRVLKKFHIEEDLLGI